MTSSQPSLPDDPRLADIAQDLARTGSACALCDSEWRLVWVSHDLKILLGEEDETKLGYGRHIIDCFMSPEWRNTITEESQLSSCLDLAPVLMHEMGTEALIDLLLSSAQRHEIPPDRVAQFAEAFRGLEPRPHPELLVSEFDYLQGDLPPFPVSVVNVKLRDETGETIGYVELYNSALPASVLALVARGDIGMFQRMARLIAPGRRQAAILFADMQESAVLSRRLPSGAYFKLVRALTTAMDEVVVSHEGIVGKHAGDGVSAFFLAQDLGSSSAAVRACIEAARSIGEAAGRAAKEIAEETGLFDPTDCVVNVGVHWGGTLFMGQLVTGGRLEVTALGDEVNECARIQEAARGGAALASKSLIEHLTADDALQLSIDPDGVVYRPVAELPGVTPKAVRDAGGIPVTVL